MSGAPAAAVAGMAAEMARELTGNILPFWLERAADPAGGFVGLVDAAGVAHPDAPRGAVLTARILWTFSAASRALGTPAYRAAADRAAAYLRAHLVDPAHGGVYWMVDGAGRPLDTRKHVYAQAFAVYGLAEHHRATGDAESLRLAVALYALVERHARDHRHGGYEEAFGRAWDLLDDVRLSEVDAPARKSTNTHLHVLEAYTGLYRAWPDPGLGARLAAVVELFLAHVVDAGRGRQRLFFDRDWTPRGGTVSFGHDVEASWLLLEAADALGDPALRARVAPAALRLAGAVRGVAFDAEHGGVYYEAPADAIDADAVDYSQIDTDKEWWPQAEAVVGFLAAYEEGGDPAFLRAAEATWAFVRRHVADAAGGEWFRRTARDGTPRPGHEKVGPWKCCYHNARACLEVMARAGAGRAPASPPRCRGTTSSCSA